jgi:hypothetical protein
MRLRTLVGLALLLGPVLVPGRAWSQARKDQARLIFTVSGGAILGHHLWSVDKQPVQFISPTDTVALGRRIRSSLAIGFGGTYFPGDYLGWAVEGFLVGLGFEDSCRLVFSSGSADLATACQSIQGATKSASAVGLSGGPVVRFNSQSLFSPYVRANLGVVFSNQSSIRTIGQFPTDLGPSDLIVYDDDHESRVEPMLGLGAGFTAQVAPGYQLRWEVRDNITGVQRVTESTPAARVIPPHKVSYQHLFSLTIGFDVVLERRRGRRY